MQTNQSRICATPGIRSQNRYVLSLDQALVPAKEDEALRMIGDNLSADEKKICDFPDYIYTGTLAKVKPGSVNLVRPKEKP